MNTIVLSADELHQAADLLKAGEIVAFPTETVYGLGACIDSPNALAAIFTAKKRPNDNPLIIHISKIEQIKELACDLPNLFYPLAEAFFPGPLTLIVKRHPTINPIVSAGLSTIAIRMPNHPLALALIDEVAVPLAAPSANLSGRPSATSALDVLDDFQGRIPAILDGGSCEIGLESTVLDLVSFAQPTLMRPGAISKEELETVIKTPVAYYSKECGIISSPGLKYRHYAPDLPVRYFSDLDQLRAYIAHSKRPFILSDRPVDGLISAPLNGKTLYSHLRFAEKNGYTEVIILCEEEGRLEPALLNRIEKILGKNESDCHRRIGRN